jgi:hypothetical protein
MNTETTVHKEERQTMQAIHPAGAHATLHPIPLRFFIRGEDYEGTQVQLPGRNTSLALASPDPAELLDDIILRDPESLHRDFLGVTVQDIIDFLVETGKALAFDRNPFMQEAYQISASLSGLTAPILEACYRQVPSYFTEPVLRTIVENEIGSRFLDGWVEVPVLTGRARVRAYGARTLHIIAGNVPIIAALTIVRGALLKSDNIIKVPSNDPATAPAILSTMRDIDRHHPVVKHFAAAYWKGGDQRIERSLINPAYLEKIIAWGGPASIQHIKGMVGPGIDLITLDPKFSISIIGEEAFRSEATMRHVASLGAIDSSTFNQEACLSSRTHFVKATPQEASQYAGYLYQSMQRQDPSLSTRPKSFPGELKEQLDALRYMEDFYQVIGGEDEEGAVVVSLTGDPVEFFPSHKTVNVVPVEDFTSVIERVTMATQSVGVYPESLKERLMDSLVARGVQRFVSLGKSPFAFPGVPQDALELMRRACKWIVDEINPE